MIRPDEQVSRTINKKQSIPQPHKFNTIMKPERRLPLIYYNTPTLYI